MRIAQTSMAAILLLFAPSIAAFMVPRGAPVNLQSTVPSLDANPDMQPSTLWRRPSSSSTSSSQLAMSKTYEKLMEKLPSKSVVDAVIDAKGDKVVASDVATRAGVSLSTARKDLTALASLSKGDISVSTDGELIYDFPSDLQSVLAGNSAKYKALQTFEKVWPSIFWGIRVSFGVALVASVVLIFSTLLFINASTSEDNDNRRRDDRGGGFGGGGLGMWWGPSPFDIFYYRPYGYYGYYGEGRNRKDPEKMGFLESVFSYIFGDGNPNQGLEERRLSLAAQMIRENNGAVTAEQLAPYCDAPDPSTISGTFVDESFVLPVVTQLDGEPRVTDEGDIVYVFPELQVSASTSSRVVPKVSESAMILKRAGLPPNASTKEIKNLLYVNRISTQGALEKQELIRVLEQALPPMTFEEEEEVFEADPSLLREREYKFSLAPDMNKFLAGGLGVVNLGGALYLGQVLNDSALYGVRLPSFLGFTQSIYPLLLAYAISFNVIPLVRNFWIKAENARIQARNQARRKWSERLKNRSGSVGRKLKAAANFATRRKQLKSDDVVYDTKTSASELGVKKERMDLDEFDKLLNDDSSFQ
eukprot:scaffold1119_cov120-Cylindrotheca_fusiformis.AAC.7